MIQRARVDIRSTIRNDAVLEHLSHEFPEFKWHCGDSDMQGTYVSGRNPEGVQIKCWTGENPMALTVSFGHSQLAAKAREAILHRAEHNAASRIGDVIRFVSRERSFTDDRVPAKEEP